MDRLEKLVIQAFKPSEGRAPIGLRDFIADHYEEFAKFHSLVAQEMISKFNVIYYYGTCVHPAIREDEEVYIIRKQDWEAIKSRWVKE